MLKDNKFDKVLKKMQQGGLTVFAPEPNQYRAPIPGVDPSIYRFNPAASFDMSPLLEMQKQQQASQLQRQKAALDREKMMHQSMMQDRKIAMEQEKEMFQMFFGNHAKSGGQATDAEGNILYSNNNPANSARFAPLFQEHEKKKMELFDQIMHVKSLPYDTKNRANILARLYQEYKDLTGSVPTTSEMEADSRLYSRAMEAISKPTANMRVNMPFFNEWISNRSSYYRNEPNSDKIYRLGEQPAGLFYDYTAGQKSFEEAMKLLNTPQVVGTTQSIDGSIITEKEQKLTLSTEAAASRLADLVISNPNLRAYMQDTYNLKLFATSPEDPLSKDDKQVLVNLIKPLISYDDDLQTFGISSTSSFKGQISKGGDGEDGAQSTSKDEANSVLSTFTSNYYDSSTGKMKTDIPQSELGKAASALTSAYTNVYGKDASSNESRTKLDRISFEFLQAGGHPDDPNQTRILQNYYNKVLYEKDTTVDIEEFRKEIEAAGAEREKHSWIGNIFQTKSSVPASSSSNVSKSASELAKIASGK